MPVKDRIKELRRVKAKDLLRNEKNFRLHDSSQQDAMRAILESIGYADALMARELEDGRLLLLNGHLRADLNPEDEIPVLVLDVNEKEGDQLLAFVDQVGQMAKIDIRKFNELVETCEFHQGAIAVMMAKLKLQGPDDEEETAEGKAPAARVAKPEYPITPVFNEKYNYVIIMTTNTVDWVWLCTQLGLTKERNYKNTNIGLGRVMHFDRFRQMWEKRPVQPVSPDATAPEEPLTFPEITPVALPSVESEEVADQPAAAEETPQEEETQQEEVQPRRARRSK